MKSIQLSLVAALAAVAVAQAATTPPQTFTKPRTATDWSDTAIFNKFDTSLGTLTGVDITLSANIADLVLLNVTADTQYISILDHNIVADTTGIGLGSDLGVTYRAVWSGNLLAPLSLADIGALITGLGLALPPSNPNTEIFPQAPGPRVIVINVDPTPNGPGIAEHFAVATLTTVYSALPGELPFFQSAVPAMFNIPIVSEAVSGDIASNTIETGYFSASDATLTIVYTYTENECELECVDPIEVCNDLGKCGAIVNFAKPQFSCSSPGVILACDPPSGSFFQVGTTTVTCTATDANGTVVARCETSVTVKDCEGPAVDCTPTVNPAGKNIPTAGENPKSGENPDGFYELGGGDNCDGTNNVQIFVKDSAEGPCGGTFAAGPYAPGTKVKLTQSPGQNSVKPMAGVIVAHINTKGDPVLVAIDSSGNKTCHICFLPPVPK